MELQRVQVKNFRSVEDSGEFSVDRVACLVGKNEAGKSAILQALAALNPYDDKAHVLDVERDYPRRRLTDYQSRGQAEEQDVVVRTIWTLDESEAEELRELIGDGLTSREVVAFRRYGDNDVQWIAPIDYAKAVAHLIEQERFNAAEKSALGSPSNSDSLRKTLESLPGRTDKHDRLLSRLNGFSGKNVRGAVEAKLQQWLPQFMYFSHYDRMVGKMRVDNFDARRTGREQPRIEAGELVFLDFLEYAGTSLSEITGARTYESLNARCEAASNRITDQLLEYWTQNPHLEIEVRITKGEPADPPPFNTGVIARARVRNNLHKVTVPFDERSAGFIWFFSFLVKFAQVRKDNQNLVLLLDEPGLTLHGKAQADLLRYFDEKLAPDHMVIFSTHSPFMVPADKLTSVRIVEDRVISRRPGTWTSEGTKVRADALATDKDTLFPLQGALGYDLTQSLFVGKHTLLVEGPGDILYLQAMSHALGERGRPTLDRRWTLCPAGGIDKIPSFVRLFSATDLDIAALTDFSREDRRRLEALRQMKLLEDDRLLTVATALDMEEADTEDVFDPETFAMLLNECFSLPQSERLNAETLSYDNGPRLLKNAESAFSRMAEPRRLNHFKPAAWLIENTAFLAGDSGHVTRTLDRGERVITRINEMLRGSR